MTVVQWFLVALAVLVLAVIGLVWLMNRRDEREERRERERMQRGPLILGDPEKARRLRNDRLRRADEARRRAGGAWGGG